jgi:hypothetical protein
MSEGGFHSFFESLVHKTTFFFLTYNVCGKKKRWASAQRFCVSRIPKDYFTLSFWVLIVPSVPITFTK